MARHGKEGEINKAAGEMPKAEVRKHPDTAGVGNETHAEVRATQEGGSAAEGLKGAVHELHLQHPIHHSDHGPHHGTDHHKRHMPLHGLRPHGHR